MSISFKFHYTGEPEKAQRIPKSLGLKKTRLHFHNTYEKDIDRYAVYAKKIILKKNEKIPNGLKGRFIYQKAENSNEVYKINKASLQKRLGITSAELRGVKNHRYEDLIQKRLFAAMGIETKREAPQENVSPIIPEIPLNLPQEKPKNEDENKPDSTSNANIMQECVQEKQEVILPLPKPVRRLPPIPTTTPNITLRPPSTDNSTPNTSAPSRNRWGVSSRTPNKTSPRKTNPISSRIPNENKSPPIPEPINEDASQSNESSPNDSPLILQSPEEKSNASLPSEAPLRPLLDINSIILSDAFKRKSQNLQSVKELLKQEGITLQRKDTPDMIKKAREIRAAVAGKEESEGSEWSRT